MGLNRSMGKGFMAHPVRKDELLAKAIVIKGRKEWYCLFRSETNVWSRAKRRRCKTDMPAGLHGKHVQALSTRNVRRLVGVVFVEWWTRLHAGMQSPAGRKYRAIVARESQEHGN